MYFRNFPKTLYSFDFSGSSPASVTNIFTRFSINSSVLNNAFGFYKYQIVDGDTPEIVADKQYGDPLLHWVISLTNNLSDPLFNFPYQAIWIFFNSKCIFYNSPLRTRNCEGSI